MFTPVVKLLAAMATGVFLAGCASPAEHRMAQMKDKPMAMHGCKMAMDKGPGEAPAGDQNAAQRRRGEMCAHMGAGHEQADAAANGAEDHSKHHPQP